MHTIGEVLAQVNFVRKPPYFTGAFFLLLNLTLALSQVGLSVRETHSKYTTEAVNGPAEKQCKMKDITSRVTRTMTRLPR